MPYTIHKTELDDFIRACHKEGLDENDFAINGHEINGILKHSFSKKVIVSKGSISREYDPARWAAQCIVDVQAGMFN